MIRLRSGWRSGEWCLVIVLGLTRRDSWLIFGRRGVRSMVGGLSQGFLGCGSREAGDGKKGKLVVGCTSRESNPSWPLFSLEFAGFH